MAKAASEFVGVNVRSVRRRRGWTQEDLVRRLDELGIPGWRQSKVAKIERGEAKRLPLDDVLELAAALGVAPLYLFTPYERDEEVRLGAIVRPAVFFRQWVRGRTPLSRMRLKGEQWPDHAEADPRFYWFESPPADEWKVERANLEAEQRMREIFELMTAEQDTKEEQ